MDIASIILTALSVIESILPLLGGTSVANAPAINTIITALTKFVPILEQLAPIAGNEVVLIYQGVKNIINNLRGDGIVTSVQQDTDLDNLDALVDTSWDKIAPQFDPDYVPSAASVSPPGTTGTT